MYQTGIENKILLKQKKLRSFTFSNVVTLGLRLKKYKEVELFIEEKSKLLRVKEKKSQYTFNLAKVYFEKGEFQKVTKLFNEKHFKEILLNIDMRILQIKAFYELKEYDTCKSLTVSTNQLLNRKEVLAYHKFNFKNFIQNVTRLLQINRFDKDAIKGAIQFIEDSEKGVTDKEWLLRKFKEL